MPTPDLPTFCPRSRPHWREWLIAHHANELGVWLVYHKKSSPTPTLTWSEAVDEALCVGWIDSVAQPIDAHTYRQRFGPRQPGSGWSRVNKGKIEQLAAGGLLLPAGLAAVEAARQNGAWTLLDEVEALAVPPDLAEALRPHAGADARFAALSRTRRRLLLLGLLQARRPETRQRRLAEIVALLGPAV